ncbi:THUMP domain-containing class I SAM-dependent RNA methyltransferase [Piscinibacter gummiphilus]|uniref:THUMP domain-containing protein n=1 Tax=Piscinibacter gummiphilus TaxID=946333 RepID=A0ABZ0CUZ0_9BURK|nr:THUMP domain-containing protein [Piscinibacter gummiphilus]WOB08765.1 THUMP domain-containing protein [Piscinibacter gummiphilus]
MALPLFLPCAAGVEPLLADEVKRILPGREVHVGRGGVGVDGDPADVMALNLESRLAQRVLAEVASGPYFAEDDIYALARGVDWTQWITPQHTLRVDTTAHRSPLRSLNFVALRVKDAVCDVLRDATGERPSVDTRHPDLPLSLHLGETHASVYVDTSGEALFKRGWREDKGEAPLKETLAAAMLAAAGWRGTPEAGGALHDPCCGSGTIAIEAAQIACGVAPGLKRRFAFERLLPFADADSRAQWQRLKSHAQSRIHASAVPIYASDVSFRMVDFARRNAQRAGVEHAIQFNGGDALERPAPQLPEGLAGTLMINPPYGERIDVAGKAARPSVHEHPDDNRAAPDDFFPRLAAHWKRAYTQHPAGWTAWVLSPDMKLPSAMRLKESRRVPMWNGPIECRLFRFDLVAGSARSVV